MTMTREEVLKKAREARMAKAAERNRAREIAEASGNELREKETPPWDDPADTAPRVRRRPLRQASREEPEEENPAPRVNRNGMVYSRGENGRLIVTTADGKVFTRKRVGEQDPFHFTPDEIPPGMSYQWIAVSVHNNDDTVPLHVQQWYENGWQPVMSSRHPGRFMATEKNAAIVRDGLMLVERPIELTREAQEEQLGMARNQIRDRNAQFNPMADSRAHPMAKLRAKRSYEKMPSDIAPPTYQPADNA